MSAVFLNSPRATLSACGNYRYRIECDVRVLPPGGRLPVVAFFGINPSLAETGLHDQTTRKWSGFALMAGAYRWIAGNPFAWRSPDVRELARVADPVGPDNHQHLEQIIRDADVLVPCWGAIKKVPLPMRLAIDSLGARLLAAGKPVRVFGFTKCGQPKHPLMLGYATPLRDWTT